MKNTGIIRKLDTLGRVVIPREIRSTRGLVEKDPIEVYIEKENVIFEKIVEENVVGVRRFLDELGRVVIPKEIRETLELTEGEKVEIWLEGNRIILKKYFEKCIYCMSQNNLTNILNKKVCKNCLKRIKKEIDNQ